MLLTILLIVMGVTVALDRFLLNAPDDVKMMFNIVEALVGVALLVYVSLWVGKYAPW